MGVRDTFEAARASAIELRRIEHEAALRRSTIGVGGHSYEYHPKSGILDPSRKVIDLLDWEMEQEGGDGLRACISDARIILAGAARIIDPLAVDALRSYYTEGRSIRTVADSLRTHAPELGDMGDTERARIVGKAIERTVAFLEQIGYAHLRDMGLPH